MSEMQLWDTESIFRAVRSLKGTTVRWLSRRLSSLSLVRCDSDEREERALWLRSSRVREGERGARERSPLKALCERQSSERKERWVKGARDAILFSLRHTNCTLGMLCRSKKKKKNQRIKNIKNKEYNQ